MTDQHTTRAQEAETTTVWSSDDTVLLGEYRHKIDAKGRLALPAKFRGQLQAGAILAKSPANSLYLFSPENWKANFDKLAALPKWSSKKALQLKRSLLGTATAVTPDRQGRILIPANLRQYGGLGSPTQGGAAATDVVVAGLGDHLEICEAGRWQADEVDLEQLAPELEDLGI